MSRHYIKQLTVGGFQVFADPVAIPLGPLTLLYGPNSAGKSAILDAMLALADLCEIQVPAYVSAVPRHHQVTKILSRHWRRGSATPAALVEELELGAIIRLGGEQWAEAGFAQREFGFGQLKPLDSFESCFSVLKPLFTDLHLDVDVSILYCLSENGTLPITSQERAQEQRIEVRINGSSILLFDEPKGVACINLDHPALATWAAAADLKWMAQRYEDGFVTYQGWLGTRISALHNGWLGTNAVDFIEPLMSDDVRRRARIAETSFISMFDALFRACMQSMSRALRVPLVPASRAVPARSDLTYLLDADGTLLTGELLGLEVNGSPEHLEVTRSAFASEMARHDKLKRCTAKLLGEPLGRPENDPLDLVNRLLADYLFSSSGYFLAAGVHELTLLSSGVSDEKAEGSAGTGRKFLVSLELSDSAGRRFNFDEVGSGLGYVLPVLLAVATSGTAFLQQPELHLHPALQSQLADALIVALGDADFGGNNAKGCHQIIAETHSEHLLLRLLRRIRQAAHPERSLDPHTLGREDVVVLYVDPKPEGGSTVKHLRISRKGGFIDRWPNGFFEERWTELFDE
ncbi:AAA family ATPase [Aquabacterium sp. G14]|uniref:AAA family ATPase n=1 Tax=Aquabacterium sp. G14 TaxID=3130164 RepID=UPI0030A6690D